MKTIKRIAAVAAAVTLGCASVASNYCYTAYADELPTYSAYIMINAGGHARYTQDGWDDGTAMTETEATFNTDGSYSTSLTIVGGSETVELLALITDINAYAYCEDPSDVYNNNTLSITIDSITITHIEDGTTDNIQYNGVSEWSMNDDGSTARVNIYNTWTSHKVKDIDNKLPNGMLDGDTLTINFTVAGINAGGGTADDTETTTEATEETTSADNKDINKQVSEKTDGNKTTTAVTGEPETEADGSIKTDVNGNTVTKPISGNSSSTTTTAANGGGSNNGTSGTGNDTSTENVSQTGDFGIAAIVLGAVATLSLGAGAMTITRKRK